jgi:hypothetical protein
MAIGKRIFFWIRKFIAMLISDMILEIRVKANNFEGCDNVYQATAKVEGMLKRSSPIFFISTGRTGTKFFAELIDTCSNVRAYHEPIPTMMSVADKMCKENLSPGVQSLIFKSARFEVMLKHLMAGLRYVESSQTLMSLIDGIILEYPNSKFVFIVRNPVGFGNSAYKKGWFKSDTVWENNRVCIDLVQEHGQIRAIFEYWLKVNKIILEKSKKYPKNCKVVKFEDVLSDYNHLAEIMDFIDLKAFPRERFRDKLSVKVNENEVNYWEHSGVKKSRNNLDVGALVGADKKFFNEEILPFSKVLGYEIN